MGGRWSSTRGKVLAAIRIGVPSRWVTPGLVDEVLAEAGQAGPGGQRFRALPGRLGVYFVLGLCLFSDLPYREVLRKLASGRGAGRGGVAGAGVHRADRGAPPARREPVRAAVLAAGRAVVAGAGAVVAYLRAAGGGLGRDHRGGAGQRGERRLLRSAAG